MARHSGGSGRVGWSGTAREPGGLR